MLSVYLNIKNSNNTDLCPNNFEFIVIFKKKHFTFTSLRRILSDCKKKKHCFSSLCASSYINVPLVKYFAYDYKLLKLCKNIP